MAKQNIELTVVVAWWITYLYLPMLRLTAWTMAALDNPVQVNEEKLHYWLNKGIKIKRK